ncbi:MAG: HsdR family type I site-specific deoxyribonuclease, partial [Nitrososphaeria archaeon]
ELQARGWRYVPGKQLPREGLEEPLLLPILRDAVKKINGLEDPEPAIASLRSKPSGAESAKDVLSYFRVGVPLKDEEARSLRYVSLFDHERPQNNDFLVSNQVDHLGNSSIRNDVILYVNGIPLVSVELKNPANMGVSWRDAYYQIKDYEKQVPELYKYAQLGVAVCERAVYFPITPWLAPEDVQTYEWRAEGVDRSDYLSSIADFLSPSTLLSFIRDYVYVRQERGKTTKVVARYMQYRASEKIVRRAIDHVTGKDERDRGLIWHWQGSGKTLTMIFAAAKLYRSKEMGNPTVFFVVDRSELEEQLYGELSALSGLPGAKRISSIDELKDVLSWDEGRGQRGLFVVLVQKFRTGELKELSEALASKQGETVMSRKDVIAFVDEAHRTQYGTLAAQMRSLLKGASFFAFTGTPLSKEGRDTYELFCPPGEKYLDKYFITDSIDDGFTLKIAYEPRLPELHLDRELLEAFWRSGVEEVPEEYRGEVEEDVKKRLNHIKVVLENPARISRVARDVAEHFRENVDGRFKAMVVAV